MAGSDPRFPSERFIAGIEFAQNMGAPNQVQERATFFMRDERQWDSADQDGRVWDPRDPGPVSGTAPPAGVQATCGVTVLETVADETAIGKFKPVALRLTFLPAAWAEVKDFVRVEFGELVYDRNEQLPPAALFDVDIHTVIVRTPDSP